MTSASISFADIFANSRSPMAVVDPDFRLTDVNAAFLKEWDVRPEAVRGKFCWEIFQQKTHNCTEDGEFCPLREALLRNKSISGHKKLHVDHRILDADFETFVLRKADGALDGFVQRFELQTIPNDFVQGTPSADSLTFLNRVAREFEQITDSVEANRYLVSLIQSHFRPDFMAQFIFSDEGVQVHSPREAPRFFARNRFFTKKFDPRQQIYSDLVGFDLKDDREVQGIFSRPFLAELRERQIRRVLVTSADQFGKLLYLGVYGWREETRLSENEHSLFQLILRIFKPRLHLLLSLYIHEIKNKLTQVLSLIDERLLTSQTPEAIVSEMADVLLKKSQKIFRVSFLLPGSEKNRWRLQFVHTREKMHEGLVGREFGSDEIETSPEIKVVNVTENQLKKFTPFQRELYQSGLRAFIHIPLQLENQLLGFLKLGFTSPVRYHAIYYDFLKTLGKHVSVALYENQKQTHYRRQQELWRHIFDSVQMGISVHDKNWTVQLANRAVVDLLGRKENEILGQKCYRIFHGTDHPIDECPYLKILQNGKAATSVMDVFNDGRQFQVSCYPRFDEKRQIVGYIHIVREVTRELQIQQQLLQQEKLATLGEIIAGVAHELNNPLTGVIGFSELIMEDPDLPEGFRDDLKTIHNEAERAKRIVQNLLFFARQAPQEKEAVNLHEAFRKALALIEYDVKSRGTQIEQQFSKEELTVWADYFQIQEVILNLVTNAAQAIELAGKGDHILIKTEKSDKYAVISVTDNGPGIPRQNLQKIFNPFFTTKPVGKGTGMGLAISYGIIQNHGGEISVRSEVGKGTTFTIRLPLYDESKDSGAAGFEGTDASAAIRGKTILILDDEETIRELLRQIFRQMGNEVLTPTHTREALEILKSVSPDIILSDVRMPDKSGFQFFDKVVAQKPALSSHFILTTGDVLSRETEEFLEKNHLPLIVKPFDIEELKKLMVDLLEKQP